MSDLEEFNVSPKLKKILVRFQNRIAAGDFYEAHQTVRTIVNRNVRTKDYKEAIDLLYIAAQILLKSSQPATGSDLTSFLLEVYSESETKVDGESKSKLIELISLFDPSEPTLKSIAIEAINWSIKFGEYPTGDPDIHHIAGSKLVLNHNTAEDAEKHLLRGTSESYPLYLELIWSWYLDDSSSKNIEQYVSRIVMSYLCLEDFRHSSDALTTLLSRFSEKNPSYQSTELNELNNAIFIYEDFPVLNFLQLLLITIDRDSKDNFQRLVSRYAKDLDGLEAALEAVGAIYFGIEARQQNNLLGNLLGGLFK